MFRSSIHRFLLKTDYSKKCTPLPFDIRRVSFIDRVDKALSGPIFRIRLPWVLETVIAVPGSIFGAMVCRQENIED